jgi:5'-nucleotidase
MVTPTRTGRLQRDRVALTWVSAALPVAPFLRYTSFVRILLVNDDGILAPGLAALRAAVADLGEVTVVAPDSPQSAAGRSITLGAPIPCQRVHVGGEFWGIGVAGRPADCVKLAVRELMDHRPDLVLSGINAGANVGVNIFYSGTVAAAAEGALLGIPSLAFSLAGGGEMDFDRAAVLCRWVLDGLLAGRMSGGQLVNVNIPSLTGRPIAGVKIAPQSTAAITESYRRQDGPRGSLAFQLTDAYEHGPQEGLTDVAALGEGCITITPLQSDLTDYRRLAELQQVAWSKPPSHARAKKTPRRRRKSK